MSKLRVELKRLVDSGELNKTIGYVNGVPKIINVNLNSIKKTNQIPISILSKCPSTENSIK